MCGVGTLMRGLFSLKFKTQLSFPTAGSPPSAKDIETRDSTMAGLEHVSKADRRMTLWFHTVKRQHRQRFCFLLVFHPAVRSVIGGRDTASLEDV